MHVTRFIWYARIGIAVILLLLVLSQGVTQYVFSTISSNKQLVIYLNNQEQRSIDLRTKAYAYVVTPTQATLETFTRSNTAWVTGQTLLISNGVSGNSSVSQEIASSQSSAHSIEDIVSQMLLIPQDTQLLAHYLAFGVFIRTYTNALIVAEDDILEQNIADIQEAALTNILLLVVILAVFIAEYYTAFRPAIKDLRAMEGKKLG